MNNLKCAKKGSYNKLSLNHHTAVSSISILLSSVYAYVSLLFCDILQQIPEAIDITEAIDVSVCYKVFTKINTFYFFFCSDWCGQNFQNYVE